MNHYKWITCNDSPVIHRIHLLTICYHKYIMIKNNKLSKRYKHYCTVYARFISFSLSLLFIKQNIVFIDSPVMIHLALNNDYNDSPAANDINVSLWKSIPIDMPQLLVYLSCYIREKFGIPETSLQLPKLTLEHDTIILFSLFYY